MNAKFLKCFYSFTVVMCNSFSPGHVSWPFKQFILAYFSTLLLHLMVCGFYAGVGISTSAIFFYNCIHFLYASFFFFFFFFSSSLFTTPPFFFIMILLVLFIVQLLLAMCFLYKLTLLILSFFLFSSLLFRSFSFTTSSTIAFSQIPIFRLFWFL